MDSKNPEWVITVCHEGVELGKLDPQGAGPEIIDWTTDWVDKDGAAGHFAREALYNILVAHPKPPNGEKMAPQAWILTVLKAICLPITKGTRSEAFEQQVFKRYTRYYGTSQMSNLVGRSAPTDIRL